MARIELDFASEPTPAQKENLQRFFEARFADTDDAVTIKVTLARGGHGWRILRVDPPRFAPAVRRVLYAHGGGDEQRGRRRSGG